MMFDACLHTVMCYLKAVMLKRTRVLTISATEMGIYEEK